MADNSLIEWTDTTWQPITGCSVVSPGCTNCYAMKLAGGRLRHHPSRAGLTVPSKAGPVWNGEVRLNEAWLDQPLRWTRPRKIFVCAHGDLFHESVPIQWIDRVFAVMALADRHTFQVLTKRAERMQAYLTAPDLGRRIALATLEFADLAPRRLPSRETMLAAGAAIVLPLPNVWLGVSAEDQPRFDERWADLKETPAAVRFLSLEPLLGPVALGAAGALDRLHWVIAGGESGPAARPMHPDWARSIRDDCHAADIAFFFKQHGEFQEYPHAGEEVVQVDADGDFAAELLADAVRPCWITPAGDVYRRLEDLPDETPCRLLERVGKKAAGRVLDGSTYSQFPTEAA